MIDKEVMKELMTIPGVGKSIALDLIKLGYQSVSELKGENPEDMYERSCKLEGIRIDRCLLYVYRCAVYFSENEKHETEKLKWWNWKY
jgi:hypothetical protein